MNSDEMTLQESFKQLQRLGYIPENEVFQWKPPKKKSWKDEIRGVFDSNTWFGNGIEEDGLDIQQEEALDMYEDILIIVNKVLEKREKRGYDKGFKEGQFFKKNIKIWRGS